MRVVVFQEFAQAAFYKLLQSFADNPWPAIIQRRLDVLVGEDASGWVMEDRVEQEVAQVLKVGLRAAMAVIKTWVNGRI